MSEYDPCNFAQAFSKMRGHNSEPIPWVKQGAHLSKGDYFNFAGNWSSIVMLVSTPYQTKVTVYFPTALISLVLISPLMI